MDNIKVNYDNLLDLSIQYSITGEENTFSVVRKQGHPFFLLGSPEENLVHSFEKLNGIIECHLTDTELRRLHRRFGHFFADRLAKILRRSGHDYNRQAIKHPTKFCDSCQKYSKSLGALSLTLKMIEILIPAFISMKFTMMKNQCFRSMRRFAFRQFVG